MKQVFIRPPHLSRTWLEDLSPAIVIEDNLLQVSNGLYWKWWGYSLNSDGDAHVRAFMRLEPYLRDYAWRESNQ